MALPGAVLAEQYTFCSAASSWQIQLDVPFPQSCQAQGKPVYKLLCSSGASLVAQVCRLQPDQEATWGQVLMAGMKGTPSGLKTLTPLRRELRLCWEMRLKSILIDPLKKQHDCKSVPFPLPVTSWCNDLSVPELHGRFRKTCCRLRYLLGEEMEIEIG